LKLTAEDLLKLGIVDEMIPEPAGGAHRDPETVAETLRETLVKHIKDLSALPADELLDKRYKKYRKIGEFIEK
jgi:acetyl-CoA carboxylase carboxyl transferase subunit alpha